MTIVLGAPTAISRRAFVKYAAIGGVAAFGVYSGLVYPIGWERWQRYGQKPWEVSQGVVDYDKVKELSYGPRSLGFANDIRNAPPAAKHLNIAQWYDYWPADVVRNFSNWMRQKWGVDDVSITWTSNIYTSNEELFTWVTQTGRKFDLMFPTNYTAETLEKTGLLVNMNKDWIPNYVNIFGRVPVTFPPPEVYQRERNVSAEPAFVYQPSYPEYDVSSEPYNHWAGFDFRDPNLNGYAYRGNAQTYAQQKPHPRGGTWGEQDGLIAVPYQWGTTGIGYRTDIFRREDIESLGWRVFELSSYTNPEYRDPLTGLVGPKTFDLNGKKMMLDDMREVFTAGLKAVGWTKQEEFKARGLTSADPTAITENPLPPYGDAPFNGEYQWSSNVYIFRGGVLDETELQKLEASRDWLLRFKNQMWGFNTVQQGPWLLTGTVYVDQAWSGDIMYAVRPNSNQHLPVEYFVPKEGGARWIDNAVIHRECEKLWIAHEFINYILDPVIGAQISDWNLYGSPNAWSFELLHKDPRYSWYGLYPDGVTPYYWNHAEDYRIYTDAAFQTPGTPGPDGEWGTSDDLSDLAKQYQSLGSPQILRRCEYQKDVLVKNTLRYFEEWKDIKF